MRDNDCLSNSATAPLKPSGKCPNFFNSARVDLCGNSARHLIENFNQLVKADIDERDTKEAEDIDLVAEVFNDCTPYLR